MVKMLHRLIGEQVQLQLTCAEKLPKIYVDAGMMEQIVLNLAVNARDAMPQGGSLTISTHVVDIDERFLPFHTEARVGRFVCMRITDTGTGIEASILDRIFEPFFTTKEVGKGTGLGLATVYGIVKQHQGWIEVESQVRCGSSFIVYLPAHRTDQNKDQTGQNAETVRGGQETILLVEDESPVRIMVRNILKRYGYQVLEAKNGMEALQVWANYKQQIHLLFTDMVMPEGLTGRELAEQLLAERPELKVIYSTGYSMDLSDQGLALQEGLNFLQKPYEPQTLAQTVRNCLDAKP
jgi:two-component system, cell cycle sensor histidine kinase and response regulator CckA